MRLSKNLIDKTIEGFLPINLGTEVSCISVEQSASIICSTK